MRTIFGEPRGSVGPFAVLALLAFLSGAPDRAQAANPEAVALLRTVQPVNLVKGGVQQFYKVFAQYPAHWSDVVGAGICQVALTTSDGKPIDPDDGKLDFAGDVEFLGSNSEAPRIAFLPAEGAAVQNIGVKKVKTYSELFPQFDQVQLRDGEPKNAILTSFSTKPNWLRLFAICGLLEASMREYTEANGSQPASLDEFLASGFSPIDFNSIDPVTGEKFHLDGAPRDIYIVLSSADAPEGTLTVPRINPVMDNGKGVPGLNIY